MLRFFSKLERSRNLVLLIFCGVLLIGLVAFYIPDRNLLPGTNLGAVSTEGKTVIAKVGSQEITLREFSSQLAAVSQQFGRGNSLPLASLKAFGMDKTVLDNLISNALVMDQASQLNLTGTNNEISDMIRRQFADNNGAFIGKEEYLRRVKLNGWDAEEYEGNVRRDITVRKVRSYLVSAEQVSERDI